jgi:hypothetical protein
MLVRAAERRILVAADPPSVAKSRSSNSQYCWLIQAVEFVH